MIAFNQTLNLFCLHSDNYKQMSVLVRQILLTPKLAATEKQNQQKCKF